MASGQLFGAVGGEYRPADTLYVARGGAYEAAENAWTSRGGAWVPLDLGGASPYVMTLELVGTPQAGTLLCTVLSAETGQPVAGVPVTMHMDFAGLGHPDDAIHGAGSTSSSGTWTWDPDWWFFATLHPGGLVAATYWFTVPHPVGGEDLKSPRLPVNGEVTLAEFGPGGQPLTGYTWLVEYNPATAQLSTGFTPAESVAAGWPSVKTTDLVTESNVIVRVIAMAFVTNPPLKPGWSADACTHWKPPATEGGTCYLFAWKEPPFTGQDKATIETYLDVMPAASSTPVLIADPYLFTAYGFGITCHAGTVPGGWPTSGNARSGWTGPATWYVETAVGDPAILAP